MSTLLASRLAEARRLLHHHFGYPDFRPAQRRVVQSVLAGRDTLAVLPTGGGKSLCFQIPALVLGGLTLVISPLISLMQDQVEALRARGLPAALLNSSLNRAAQERVLAEVAAGGLRMLYLSPERLGRLAQQLAESAIRPVLLAGDEAHCIAEWGHDFRPSYRRLRALRYRLGGPQTVALTGSATPEVRQDIVAALGLRRPDLHLGSFDRPNLWFGVVPVGNEAQRLRRLIDLLRADDRLAIVYAPTRNVTEAIARVLVDEGFRAAPYHAGLTKPKRTESLERFLNDEVEVIVATCAFGMGIDKPNVRLVVHWTMPPSPESYYQEAGRAGRDGDLARCILLHRSGDAELHRRQLEVTFPRPALLARIWREPDGRRGVPSNVLASADRLARELHPERGAVDWRPVIARRRKAEARIAAMERHAGGRGCRRRSLIGYFGEWLAECAGCGGCRARIPSRAVDPLVTTRLAALRRVLASRKAPWEGCLLEPETLRRLAEGPPVDAGALADVPGVGPVIAERFGAVILDALGGTAFPASDPTVGDPTAERLIDWRNGVAKEMGVPAYLVLTDGMIRDLVRLRPSDRAGLGRVPGLGPRRMIKFGEALLERLAGNSPPTPSSTT